MDVYWTNIEYRIIDVYKNNIYTRGMVYAFVKSKDAISALNKIVKSHQFKDKKIIKCEFVCPYNPALEKWAESVEFGTSEETTAHYRELYTVALHSRLPVFDYFGEYKR